MATKTTTKRTKMTMTATTTTTMTKTLMKKTIMPLKRKALFFHDDHCQITDKYDFGPLNYSGSHKVVIHLFSNFLRMTSHDLHYFRYF